MHELNCNSERIEKFDLVEWSHRMPSVLVKPSSVLYSSFIEINEFLLIDMQEGSKEMQAICGIMLVPNNLLKLSQDIRVAEARS